MSPPGLFVHTSNSPTHLPAASAQLHVAHEQAVREEEVLVEGLRNLKAHALQGRGGGSERKGGWPENKMSHACIGSMENVAWMRWHPTVGRGMDFSRMRAWRRQPGPATGTLAHLKRFWLERHEGLALDVLVLDCRRQVEVVGQLSLGLLLHRLRGDIREIGEAWWRRRCRGFGPAVYEPHDDECRELQYCLPVRR